MERNRQGEESQQTAPYTRDRLTLIALLIIAGVGIGLTILVAGPFLPGLTWALAFAVVAWPLHQWISGRIPGPGMAAGLSVTIVALVLILPIVFVGWQIGKEAKDARNTFQKELKSGEWRQKVQQDPRLAKIWDWVEANVNVEQEIQDIAETIQQRAPQWMKSFVWGTVQIVTALFALFFFFRDRQDVLNVLRSLMPMTERETDYFFERVRAMTHATIYGTLVVSAIQGALGGTMFWMLGVPGALLWGFAMGVLSIIPMLGAFTIWMPVAVFLAMQGSWGKAAVLTAWGTLVVSTIDNVLYPILVGKEMRLHTLPVFISIVGGLIIFGAAGLVLGPVILTATVAVLDILRARTAHGKSAEQPTS